MITSSAYRSGLDALGAQGAQAVVIIDDPVQIGCRTMGSHSVVAIPRRPVVPPMGDAPASIAIEGGQRIKGNGWQSLADNIPQGGPPQPFKSSFGYFNPAAVTITLRNGKKQRFTGPNAFNYIYVCGGRTRLNQAASDIHGDVLGANHTDAATVTLVQKAICALPSSKSDPAFKALAQALVKQKNAWGSFGPATKTAVARFNDLYGWKDGPVITDGTLEALKRPDLQPGASPSAPAAPPAPVTTAPVAVETAAKVADAAADVVVKAADTAKAVAAADPANPTKAAVAAEATQKADVAVAAASEAGKKLDSYDSSNPLTRVHAGLPAWGWGVVGVAGVMTLGMMAKMIFGARQNTRQMMAGTY